MPTEIILGFALGILSAIFFAFYMVPQKLTRMDTVSYLWVMAIGVLCTSLVAYGLAGFPQHATLVHKGLAIMCGLVWGVGTMAFAGAIARIGLTSATPIKNTTGVIGTLVGLVLFQEWRTTDPALALGGSLLIVASAIVIGMTGDEDTPHKATLGGILLALLAALCYASYLYPMKQALQAINTWEFAPWMAVGILITATIAVTVRPGGWRAVRAYPPRHHGLALLGGVAWALALFSLAVSMLKVDLAVAWSLAQLNTLPAVFMGIVVFHEVHWRTHWPKIMLGLLAATIGTVLLGWAK